MGTEAVFGNAVAPVTSTLAPTTMFTLPIVCTMVLPNIALAGMLFVFVPVCRAHVLRPIRRLVMGLLVFRPVLACPRLLVGALFAPLLMVIGAVFV
jgi:hypothetical protein